MKCRYTSDDIDALIEGLLSIDKEESIRHHIEECKECKYYFDSITLAKSYICTNIKLKTDIHQRVIENLDYTRYRNKRLTFLLQRFERRVRWVFKPAIALLVAVAVVFLIQSIYTDDLLRSNLFEMFSQTEKNSVESNNNVGLNLKEVEKGFLNEVVKGDALLYALGSKYYLVHPDGYEYELDLPDTVFNQQACISDDLNTVYYITISEETGGRLVKYDINEKKRYDLLDELGIELDEHIYIFSYKDDKIIASTSVIRENDEFTERAETNRLLVIDIKNKSHKFIDLTFTPWLVSSYRGLDFWGDNYLICYLDRESGKNPLQRTVAVDDEGKIVSVISLSNSSSVVNVQVSPDNKMILYQKGQTPVDLYLFDTHTGRNISVFNSSYHYNLSGDHTYCFYSTWSRFKDTFYYVLSTHKEDGEWQNRFMRKTVDEAEFERGVFEEVVYRITLADRIEMINSQGIVEGSIEGRKIEEFADLIRKASADELINGSTDGINKVFRMYIQGEIINLNMGGGNSGIPAISEYKLHTGHFIFIHNLSPSPFIGLFKRHKSTTTSAKF